MAALSRVTYAAGEIRAAPSIAPKRSSALRLAFQIGNTSHGTPSLCKRCQSGKGHAFQLYCSYCDEILTGSIAGPGGKIADHIITIRHIVKEAAVQNQYFESKGRLSPEEYQHVVAYVAKLEQWASAIRFQRNYDEKRELEQVLRSLQHHLQEAGSHLRTIHLVCAALTKPYSHA